MNFPDQYHAAAVWQQHVLDEKNQRRLAQLVARRQRRGPRRPLRVVMAALTRRVGRRRAPAAAPARTRPAGCAV